MRSRLGELSNVASDWTGEADIVLSKELRRLSAQLDRTRKLKRGGLSLLPENIGPQFCQLLVSLRQSGVFLVPLGELEDWLSEAGIQESRENKWAWANSAAVYIQSQGAQKGDVWDFVRDIGRYLSR